MATLAPKLPYQHPFAGGYPGRGGQYLPTDPDATDYLSRLAEVDGASVEVGIAQAIEAFIVGCKADNAGYAGDATRTNWDAIKASCVMCGARTLSGALVPLKGDAPTSYNFASGDYSRSTTPGLKGDGSTKYLDSGRANDADGQNDNHNAVYYTYVNPASAKLEMGAGSSGVGANNIAQASSTLFVRNRSTLNLNVGSSGHVGLGGVSRSSASEISYRIGSSTATTALTSEAASSDNVFVFARNNGSSVAEGETDARLAFYSIGAALDLAALDTRVTNLVNGIKFHSLTGLLPNDYDPDTISYIVSAIEAGGTL